jgi:hypothetical protein
LIPPPGHTLEDARKLIQATHNPSGQPAQVSSKVPLHKSIPRQRAAPAKAKIANKAASKKSKKTKK